MKDSILNIPSPLQKVDTTWSKNAGIDLFVKRDDLIHPLISGNKWRKLSGILEHYQGYTSLHTFGGAYSNHLIATAKAAEILGIDAHAYIRGDEPRALNMVLSLCASFGMKLHFLDREEYRERKRMNGLHGNDLYIAEGGACLEGTIGCEEIVNEDEEKMDHYLLACGTGTSLAGIAKGLKNNPHVQLWGVPVLKNGSFIAEDVRSFYPEAKFELLLDFHFGGYARSSPELVAFISSFAKDTGILLDPIYTSKAFYAAMSQAKAGAFKEGEKVCLIHTGGLTGWYGKWTDAI